MGIFPLFAFALILFGVYWIRFNERLTQRAGIDPVKAMSWREHCACVLVAFGVIYGVDSYYRSFTREAKLARELDRMMRLWHQSPEKAVRALESCANDSGRFDPPDPVED